MLRLQRRQRLTVGPPSPGAVSPGLPERPLLAPWYRLVHDDGRLLLEHGRSVVVVAGSAVETLLPVLLPLLDGTRTVDGIVAELGERHRAGTVRALELLGASGVLVGGAAPGAGPDAASLAAACGVAPGVVAQRLQTAEVGVAGGAAGPIAALLRAAGVGSVRALAWGEAAGAAFAVVAPTPAETPLLADWNRAALAASMPWLPVRPYDGLVASVGPLVVPGESACYECLLLRLAGHLEYGADLARIEATPLAAPATGALELVTAAVAAELTLRWLGGADVTLPGKLHVLETRPVVSLVSHPVLRVPRCAACSPVERLAPPLPWHEAEAA